MPIRFDKYRMKDGETPLAERFFNAVFQDLDARLASLEDTDKTWQETIADLTQTGLQRINDYLAPEVDKIRALAKLGFLNATIQDGSNVNWALGATGAVISEGPERDLFVPGAFVAITRESDPSAYLIARTLSYDAETGGLSLDVLTAEGGPGPFTDLHVWALAGSFLATKGQADRAEDAATAAEASKTSAESARAGAEAAETGAISAKTAAEAARAGAETAQTAAEAAQAAAEFARDQAQAISGGPGQASDTTPGIVELATPAEATAGTDTVRVVTPAGLKAAIDAVIGGAPSALNTLKELADALGDDANFASTVTNALAGKESTANKNQPDGYAGLDGSGKVATGQLPVASTAAVGAVRLATAAEAQAGTDTSKAITPSTLAAGVPTADTTKAGKVRLATTAETLAGAASDLAVTPAGLAATEASDAEIRAGSAATQVTARRLYTAVAPVASSGSGAWAPDFSAGINFDRTLTGTSTLSLPTNAKVGQSGYILIRQDGTGSRTLAFDTFWDFGSGAPTLSTAANSIDVIPYLVVSSTKAVCGFRKGS